MRFTVKSAMLALALAGGVVTAGAQQVRGTVHASGTAAPLTGVTIVLIDSTGRLIGGTLSDSAGRYALRTTTPGTYRVRVRRIGFAPDTTHVVVLAGDVPLRLDLVLRAVPSLERVVVRAARSCDRAASPDSAAVRIWDATQGALTATLLTPQAARLGFVLRRYEREVDAATGRVIREQAGEARSLAATPYASISADSLAAHGFVQRETAWSTYYAPDAGTLISDSFVASHCFHAVQADAHPELVGLAFEPNRTQTTLEDVEGTLWLDRATSELRFLRFSYRRPGRSATDEFSATGRVDYRRLPGIGWIVSAWQIDVPIVRAVRTQTARGGEPIGSTMTLSTRTTAQVAKLVQVGGEVVSTFSTATADELRAARASIAGRLTEEGRATPIRGGIVRIVRDGTNASRTVTTDSTGAFRFDDVESGRYMVQASASSGTASPATTLDIRDGTRITLTIGMPASPGLMATFCPAGLPKGTALLHGRVTALSGEVAAPGVIVRARWNTILRVREGEYSVTPEQRLATTLTDGQYGLCGIPRGVALFVSVARGSRRGAELRTQADTNDVMTLDLHAP